MMTYLSNLSEIIFFGKTGNILFNLLVKWKHYEDQVLPQDKPFKKVHDYCIIIEEDHRNSF